MNPRQKKALVALHRPLWLKMIGDIDKKIKLLKLVSKVTSVLSTVNNDPSDIPMLKAEKAFLICMCNSNKTEATIWLEKIKKHALEKMEFTEDGDGCNLVLFSMEGGINCTDKHENEYLSLCNLLKTQIEDYELILSFLQK
jgi:hypothetical protein